MDLLAGWTSPDDYSTRVVAIDTLLSVDDDEEEDLLTGSSGRDLFYDGLGDTLTDRKSKKDPESVLKIKGIPARCLSGIPSAKCKAG